jgi:hypothetical protein
MTMLEFILETFATFFVLGIAAGILEASDE